MQDFIAQFGDYAPLIFLLLASILPIFFISTRNFFNYWWLPIWI